MGLAGLRVGHWPGCVSVRAAPFSPLQRPEAEGCPAESAHNSSFYLLPPHARTPVIASGPPGPPGIILPSGQLINSLNSASNLRSPGPATYCITGFRHPGVDVVAGEALCLSGTNAEGPT